MKKILIRAVWRFVILLYATILPVQALGQMLATIPRTTQFQAGEIIIKVRDELSAISERMKTRSINTGSRNLDVLNQQFGVKEVSSVFQLKTDLLRNFRSTKIL